MPKNYSIRWNLDDTSAQAAFKRGLSSMAAVEKAALKAAKAQESVLAAAANGHAATATAAANGHAAVAAGAAKSASAQANGVNRVTAAALNGVATRRKAAADLSALEDKYLLRDLSRRAKYEKQKESSALGAYGRLANVERRALTDEQVRAAARVKYVDAVSKKRIDAAMHAMGAEKDAFAQGIAGAFGLSGALTTVGAAAVGIGAMVKGLSAINEGYEKIRRDAEAAAEATLTLRKGLRVESVLKGAETTDNAKLHESLQFRAATGLGEAEASDLTRQYLGALPVGLQKKNITEPVAKDLMTQVGVLQARQGGDAGTRGELAGLLGQFTQVKSVEQGLGQLEAIRMGLTEGRGDDTPLTRQLLKASGAIVKEGGAVGSLPEMAALIGVTSLSAGPEEAGTRAEQINRALKSGLTKQTKGKGAVMPQAQYLKGLGITEKDSLEESLGKLVPDLQKAEASGRDVEVYLAEHGFRNFEERRAIKELVPNFDVLKERMAKARAAQDGGAVRDANTRFLESPSGRANVGDQLKAAAEVTKGLQGERLAALKRQTEASPEFQAGEQSVLTSVIGDTARGLLEGHLPFLSEKGPMAAGRQSRLDAQTIADLQARATKAGVTREQLGRARTRAHGAPDFEAEYANQVESLIASRGGKVGPDPKPVMERLAEAVEKSNKIAAAQAGGGGKAPAPLPAPPRPGPGR